MKRRLLNLLTQVVTITAIGAVVYGILQTNDFRDNGQVISENAQPFNFVLKGEYRPVHGFPLQAQLEGFTP